MMFGHKTDFVKSSHMAVIRLLAALESEATLDGFMLFVH